MLRPLVGMALLTVVWSATGFAQAQRSLHGTVKDAQTGSPIAAAEVSVRGTKAWASTTSDGQFTLGAPAGALTLEVRRIGFTTASLPVAADQNELEITLRASALELSEVIVTGQATGVARRNLANDVASVSSQDLTQVHTQTLENALQGQVAGTIITANSGAPGGGLQVRMRGVTSIFGNSQPLYVVDGVPVSNSMIENGLNAVSNAAAGGTVGLGASNQDNGVDRIADLAAEDVDNIEILKGPSAAAIYGSSAANGVVIITTKRGLPGPTRFSLTQRIGTNALSNEIGERRFTLASAIAYAAPLYCAGTPTCSADSAAVNAMFQRSGGFEDFEKDVFGDKSLSYQTDLSISGGSERTQYFVNGLNQHDNGTMYGTGYDKQGLQTNLTTLVGSKLQVRANVNFTHTLTRRGFSNNDNVGVTPYFVISFTPSFFSFKPFADAAACSAAIGAANCTDKYPLDPFAGPPFTNVIQTLDQFSLPEDVFRFRGSVEATYTFLNTEQQSLRATLNAGVDNYSYKANIYAPATLTWQQATGLPGLASDLTQTETQAPAALTITHSYTPNSNAFTATTSAGVRSGFDNIRNNNVVTQNLLAGQQNVNLGTATVVFENRQRVRTLALFGQEEVLLLNQRLFLSAGVLGQRSTNNADVNKLFAYPKAAASYRWPTLGPFQELKLRAAFGETGNEPLYGQKFTALTGLTYTGQNAVAIQGNLADPTLHPEREREIEAGVDAGLLDGRVAFSGTVYQKNNTDLLLQATLAPSTGYATHVFNGGEIRNRGIEAEVSGFPVRTKDVSWHTRATFTLNRGIVLSLPASVAPAFNPPNFFAFIFGAGRIEVGHSPSQIYGYDTDTIAYPTRSKSLHQIGDYEPRFTMGFSSEATYHNFRLFGLLEWRHGGNVVNLTQNGYDEAGLAPDSAASANRLHLFNDLARSPYIQDASFVKLREVTLSYQIPDQIIRSAFSGRVTGARVDVGGRNLLTWTPYAGTDPEVSNFGNQNINRGQDVTPYPPFRSFFLTLAVDF
ncbi:MAG TPA: SusC/RagA family TonB-linked outer membrane protein [Gemmatimonadales bacterium]|nr:SusC/RagA family TonB-linked outer membrane protein [Gemmatimonadales bacterium]